MTRIEQAVRRANIVHDLDSFQTGIPHVPPFLSTWVLAGCFDIHGFMSRPKTGVPEGRTVLACVGHYERVEHGRHVQYPLAVIRAAFADGTDLNLVDCTSYRQELDLYTGTLTTEYGLYGHARVTAFFSQAAPNLFCMKIERKADRPAREIVLSIECDGSISQNNDTRIKVGAPRVSFDSQPGRMRVLTRTNCTETEWIVHCPGAAMETVGSAVNLRIPPGGAVLKILAEHPGGADESVLDGTFEQLHASHAAEWAKYWEEAWAEFPEDRAHRIWTRTNYYAGCNFPAITARPMEPTGGMSNIWGFTFPQDVYYVAENLPRLGHFHRSLKAMQYWLDVLEDVKAYSRRVMGVEGGYYPWTPPHQDWDRFEADGVCCADSYELHNPAYVAAIVWHCYLITLDAEMLANFFPVIEEVFRFYCNISEKNSDGTYDIFHERARGQDEASSTDGRLKNLLCAQYGAEYTARAYLQASLLVDSGDAGLFAKARDIVASGYTKKPLLRPEGWYATYEGDDRPLNSQKHPVQLNPIAFLPMANMVAPGSSAELAWQSRYDLTHQARRPHTPGWTYGEFALASARMRAPAEMEKDLRALQPCRSADPRWIQFYESSFQEGWHLRKAYYFPMSGLFLQAFTDCLMQDWRGHIDLFACLLPGWAQKEFSFTNFRARGGIVVSGEWHAGGFAVQLRPAAGRSAKVRVSRAGARIAATGQGSGPSQFGGDEIVEFEFDGDKPIILTGQDA